MYNQKRSFEANCKILTSINQILRLKEVVAIAKVTYGIAIKILAAEKTDCKKGF